MSYDKEIIKYAMTRILTDKRYSEQGEKWARFYLLKALDNTDLLTYYTEKKINKSDLVLGIDNVLECEFGLPPMKGNA